MPGLISGQLVGHTAGQTVIISVNGTGSKLEQMGLSARQYTNYFHQEAFGPLWIGCGFRCRSGESLYRIIRVGPANSNPAWPANCATSWAF